MKTNDTASRKSLVAIIDDDILLLESLGQLMELQGFENESASSAEEGLAMLEGIAPDLIIVDGNLPGMKGDKMIEKLREEDSTTPVLALSAECERESGMIEAGANEFMAKPMDIPKFLDTVKELIAVGR